jgi:predicted O-linked N-acetylglucosamine transferase (SPINDLY family)
MPPIVYPPPRPPINGKINLGYVSSDLGNHPLSHLMQSVFGYHDLNRFNVFVYATSPSDKSPYRLKIENESQHFYDVSAESTQQIVDRIVQDEIHVLINLSGYTKGARNEVFAARPAPVQMSYMGFASTLSAGWCDYFIVGKSRLLFCHLVYP